MYAKLKAEIKKLPWWGQLIAWPMYSLMWLVAELAKILGSILWEAVREMGKGASHSAGKLGRVLGRWLIYLVVAALAVGIFLRVISTPEGSALVAELIVLTFFGFLAFKLYFPKRRHK